MNEQTAFFILLWITTVITFKPPLPLGYSECKNPLGLTTGAILDAFITSSYSYIPGSSEPKCVNETQARLYVENTGYWCTDKSQPVPTTGNLIEWTVWLQIQFPKISIIKGLAVQALKDDNRIEKFALAFATSQNDFQFYTVDFIIKEFQINSAHVQYIWLSDYISAKYIRLLPISVVGTGTLKLEYYGCTYLPETSPLGLSSGFVRDSQLSASSGQYAKHARLHSVNNGWSGTVEAHNNAVFPSRNLSPTSANLLWLQIDFLKKKKIVYFDVQRCTNDAGDDLQLTGLWFSYGENVSSLEWYAKKGSNNEPIHYSLPAINGTNTIVPVVLEDHIIASILRIYPSFTKNGVITCLKLEAYGHHYHLTPDHLWKFDSYYQSKHFLDLRGYKHFHYGGRGWGFYHERRSAYKHSIAHTPKRTDSFGDDCLVNPDNCKDGFSVSVNLRTSITRWNAHVKVGHANITVYSSSACTKQPAERLDFRDWIGMHYPDVRIPPFAKIRGGEIYFRAKERDTSGGMQVQVFLLYEKPLSYVENCEYVSDTSLETFNAGIWTVPGWRYKDERDHLRQRYTGLGGQLQKFVKLSSWRPGQSVTVIFKPIDTGSGAKRVAHSGEDTNHTPYVNLFYFTVCPGAVVPLGLSDSAKFPNSKFTSSSVTTSSNPHDVRLNGNGWCPGEGASPRWIQVDVGEYRAITMIATLGGTTQSDRVTKFSIMYSEHGTTYEDLKDRATNTKMVFNGNAESARVKYNPFPELTWGRYFKIVVDTQLGTGCIRFELYGCSRKAVPEDNAPIISSGLHLVSNEIQGVGFLMYETYPTKIHMVVQTRTTRWSGYVPRSETIDHILYQVGFTWSPKYGLITYKNGELVHQNITGYSVSVSGQIPYQKYIRLAGFYSVIYSPTWLILFEARMWRRFLNDSDYKMAAYGEEFDDFSLGLRGFDSSQYSLTTGCSQRLMQLTGPCSDKDTYPDPQPALLYNKKITSTGVYINTACDASPSVLHLGFANCVNQPTITALHFSEVNLHKSDKIISATLSLKADSSSASQVTKVKFTVARRQSNFVNYLQTCGYKDYSTHAVVPYVNWTIHEWENGKTYWSANITQLIQFIVDDYSWVKPDEFIILILTDQDFASGACRKAVILETQLVIKYSTRTNSYYLFSSARDPSLTEGTPQYHNTPAYGHQYQCLSFWYYMYGDQIGTFSIFYYRLGAWKEIFRKAGSYGQKWHFAMTSISSGYQVYFRFLTIHGSGRRGDVAVDNLMLSKNSSCPQFSDSETSLNNEQLTQLNLPIPVFVFPLRQAGWNVDLGKHGLRLSSHGMRVTWTDDVYRYPYYATSFSSYGNKDTTPYVYADVSTAITEVDKYFSLLLHVRQTDTKSNRHILHFTNTDYLKGFALVQDGTDLKLKARHPSTGGNQTHTLLTASGVLRKNQWSRVAVIYKTGKLSIYINEKFKVKTSNTGLIDMGAYNSLYLDIDPIQRLSPPTNGHPSSIFHGYISCLQFYKDALEEASLQTLMFCISRHSGSACPASCYNKGYCQQMSGTCACSSYSYRLATINCSNALDFTLYKDALVYFPLDYGKDVEDFKNNTVMSGNVSSATDLDFVEGPVNYAICVASPVTLGSIPGSCFRNMTTCIFFLSFWLNLDSWIPDSGLLKIGRLSIHLNQAGDHNGSALVFWDLNGSDNCLLSLIPVTFKSWTFYVLGLDQKKISVTLNNETTLITDHNCSLVSSQLSVDNEAEILLGNSDGGTTCIDEIAIFTESALKTQNNSDVHHTKNVTHLNNSDIDHTKNLTHLLNLMEKIGFYEAVSKGSLNITERLMNHEVKIQIKIDVDEFSWDDALNDRYGYESQHILDRLKPLITALEESLPRKDLFTRSFVESFARSASDHITATIALFFRYVEKSLQDFIDAGSLQISTKLYTFTRTDASFGVPSNRPELFTKISARRNLTVEIKVDDPEFYHGNIGYWIDVYTSITGNHTFVLKTGNYITLKGLYPGTRHIFNIYPFNVRGYGPRGFNLEATTEEDVPYGPPENITSNATHDQIIIFTDGIHPAQKNGIILGYDIFYLEVSKLPASVSQYQHTNVSAGDPLKVENLEPFTNYSIFIRGFNKIGASPLANFTRQTGEWVPEQAPTNLTASLTDENRVNLSWIGVPEDPHIWNSWDMPGYEIAFSKYVFDNNYTSSYLKASISGKKWFYMSEVLDPFCWYNVTVAAMTKFGPGLKATNLVRTHEGVPVGTPTVLSGWNTSSSSLQARVGQIPKQDERGIIVRYNLSITKVQDGVETKFISAPITQSFDILSLKNLTGIRDLEDVADTPATSEIVITPEINNLNYYAEYEISACGCTDVGCGHFGSKVVVRTDEHVPTCSPLNIKIKDTSSTSLMITWDPPPSYCSYGKIVSYQLFLFNSTEDAYQKLVAGTVASVSKMFSTGMNTQNLTSLEKFWNYSTVIKAFTSKGGGPLSPAAWGLTGEDVPDGRPSDISAEAMSSTSLNVTLQSPSPEESNGIIVSYEVYYEETKDTSRNGSQVFPATDSPFEFYVKNLRKYRNYTLRAAAITSVGKGPFSAPITVMTGEDVPEMPPSFINITNRKTTSISVIWGEVPIEGTLGIKVAYEVSITGILLNGSIHSLPSIEVNSSTFKHTFNNLLPAGEYTVSVALCTNPGCGVPGSTAAMTKDAAPDGFPNNITSHNMSGSTIHLFWKEVSATERNGKVINYLIRWIKASTVHYNNTLASTLAISTKNSTFKNTTVTGLDPFSYYYFFLAAETAGGFGPEALISLKTDEAVPVAPPGNVKAENVSSSVLLIEWSHIIEEKRRGILLGYRIYFHEVGSGNETNVTVSASTTSTEITGLKRLTNYSISVVGFTIKGEGVSSNRVIGTTELAIDGHWSSWSNWDTCSTTCGPGQQRRNRSCSDPAPFNGGNNCTGDAVEMQACTVKSCEGFYLGPTGKDCNEVCKMVDLGCSPLMNTNNNSHVFTEALDSSGNGTNKALTSSCETSSSFMNHAKKYHPSYLVQENKCVGFKAVPYKMECNGTELPSSNVRRLCYCMTLGDIGFRGWAPWSLTCTKPCGGGTIIRHRECLTGFTCNGSLTETQNCNEHICPTHGNWTEWTSWSSCSKSCGGGSYLRHRSCINPPPSNGGEPCTGNATEEIPNCNVNGCPVSGSWGAWQPWKLCEKPCGGTGFQRRVRECNNPEPKNGGAKCPGVGEESLPCNPNPCKQDIRVDVVCKFTNLTYTHALENINSPDASALSNEICAAIKMGVYENSSAVGNCEINGFSEGSVISNFSVWYQTVPFDQIIILQESIDSIGLINNMPVVPVSTASMDVPTNPPVNITTSSLTASSIFVKWEDINPGQVNGALYSYYVFYRESQITKGNWSVQGTQTTNTTIEGLLPFRKYILRVLASISGGNGISSTEMFEKTKEGAPLVAPPNLSSTFGQDQIYVEWDPIPYESQGGNLVGYRITIYEYGSSSSKTDFTTPHYSRQKLITGLRGFTVYVIEVSGYTSIGNGPKSVIYDRTLNAAPCCAPLNVTAAKRSSSSLSVHWNELEKYKCNGILLGYKVRWKMVAVSGIPLIGESSGYNLKDVDPYSTELVLNGLQSYSSYSVTVSAYTDGGEGPQSSPVIGESCRCPNIIWTNWYHEPPYMTKINGVNNTKFGGIFPEFITESITFACGQCPSYQSLTINYFRGKGGRYADQQNELAVRDKVNDEVHVSFPLSAEGDITVFAGFYQYVSIVDSPGFTVIIRNDFIDESIGPGVMIDGILKLWPMFLICILLSYPFGIVMWMADSSSNPEFPQRNVLTGGLQGFWWAYVTMTTVGYGDINPVSIIARIITILWCLIGLVLMGILVGSIGGALYVSVEVGSTISIDGAKIAAIHDSPACHYAIHKSLMLNNETYTTTDQVLQALRSREAKVALLDLMTIGTYQNKLGSMGLRLQEIIKTTSSYGMVLSGELVRLQTEISSYISSENKKITNLVKNLIGDVEVQVGTEVEEIDVFQQTSATFQSAMYLLTGLLLVFCLFGYGLSVWRKHRQKKLRDKDPNSDIFEECDDIVQEFVDAISRKLEETDEQFCFQRLRLKNLQDGHRWKNIFSLRKKPASRVEPHEYFANSSPSSSSFKSTEKLCLPDIAIQNSTHFKNFEEERPNSTDKTKLCNSDMPLVSSSS